MRLIDADALLEELPVHPDGGLRTVKEECLMIRVRETVKAAPTVAPDTNVLDKWISVKDRLPEQEKTVIVARKYVQPGHKEIRYVETAELVGTDWVSIEDEYKIHRQFHTNPYAWMPMPEPPQEVTGDAD